MSFRDYVLGRKYDYGRGSPTSWKLIAFARGDDHFPDVVSFGELLAYLGKNDVPDELTAAAKAVWSSYTSLRSRNRARASSLKESQAPA